MHPAPVQCAAWVSSAISQRFGGHKQDDIAPVRRLRIPAPRRLPAPARARLGCPPGPALDRSGPGRPAPARVTRESRGCRPAGPNVSPYPAQHTQEWLYAHAWPTHTRCPTHTRWHTHTVAYTHTVPYKYTVAYTHTHGGIHTWWRTHTRWPTHTGGRYDQTRALWPKRAPPVVDFGPEKL